MPRHVGYPNICTGKTVTGIYPIGSDRSAPPQKAMGLHWLSVGEPICFMAHGVFLIQPYAMIE